VERSKTRFERILREHGPGLGRVVASYARPANQDDLAQEVSIAIWNALGGFRGECSERTFVFRIAHNRGLSHLARRRTHDEPASQVLDGAPDPEVRAGDREEMARLFTAIRGLPVPQRQVLTLSLEGMTHAEIGSCVGITAEHVAVRLSRARAALRKRMEEPWSIGNGNVGERSSNK
jgi:RNA polymerase sigma factor (sigma-70 family)